MLGVVVILFDFDIGAQCQALIEEIQIIVQNTDFNIRKQKFINREFDSHEVRYFNGNATSPQYGFQDLLIILFLC
jgi:hypothetical protein